MPKRNINKSDFVRKLGDIPAKAVVEKAKAAGVRLSVAHVYTIRSAAKRKKGAAGATPVPHLARRGRPRKAAASQGLRSSLDRLVATFVEEMMSAVRGASLEELLGR